jgi:hypothetical protein
MALIPQHYRRVWNQSCCQNTKLEAVFASASEANPGDAEELDCFVVLRAAQ